MTYRYGAPRWLWPGVLAALSGCHRETAPSGGAGPSPVATASAQAPVDHLGPNELLDGTESAFALVLPRGMTAEGAFPDVVYASGALDLHAVTAYLRARLVGGEFREGDSAANFDGVHVPSEPQRSLHIHVTRSAPGVRLEVRDVTPAPVAPLPDERARWRRVGLTPEGRLADPTHLD